MSRRQWRKLMHARRMARRQERKAIRREIHQLKRSWDAASAVAPPSPSGMWQNVGTYANPVLEPIVVATADVNLSELRAAVSRACVAWAKAETRG